MKILLRVILFFAALALAGKIPGSEIDAEDDEVTDDDTFGLDLKKPPV